MCKVFLKCFIEHTRSISLLTKTASLIYTGKFLYFWSVKFHLADTCVEKVTLAKIDNGTTHVLVHH